MAELLEPVLVESKHIRHYELEILGGLSMVKSVGSTLEEGEFHSNPGDHYIL